ncbi:hypothetical protein B0H21DRAFT_881892 [Amylocystis lapponica]|nr:hypothetical protein B0H21DRAFT_881892 [Amylocystis lapponica]
MASAAVSQWPVKKSKVKIDLGFLDAPLLRSEVAIEDALSILDSYLENLTVNASYIVMFLMSRPHLFEFIASDSLSLSLIFVPTLAADELAELKAYRHIVVHTRDVLSALGCGKFDDGDMLDNDGDIFGGLGKKKTQHKKKLHKRRDTTIDPKPFEGLGLRIPSTLSEAEETVNQVLTQRKDILQLLRKPGVTDTFRSAYIPVEAPAYDATNNLVEMEPLLAADTVVETSPVAYPMVQPIKAALYFDSADGFGDWRILISTRADADLRQTRKREVKLFDIILKKIKELSRGHFSEDNHKVLTGPETDIPIFEAKMTRDSRLVYQIDCVPEFESHVERQVIRIFGIYTHAQLDGRFWEGVSFQLSRKGKEYRARHPQVRGDNVFKPGSWPPTAETNDFAPSTGIPHLHKDDLSKLHELLVLEKYVTFSQALLNGVLADKDIQHVFNVSKTTTMMFKMLGIERSTQAYGTTMPKVRQLFVTQSAVLAVKVEEFFMKLLGSLNMAGLSPEELAQIDISARIQQDRGMVDHDEEIAHQEDVPKRFSDLTDDHFPMFITFNQLCSLLEADLDVSIPIHPPTRIGISSMDDILSGDRGVSMDYMHQSRPAFVSYTVFQQSYWPSFPQSLKNGLDPTLLFGEFMGVIQGSEKTLLHGCLNKTTYINLSHRQYPTFSSIRDTVWQLFEKYSKKKRERYEYDAADRTHMILKKLRDGELPGKQLDFIYIDEAQDNLLVDALILRMICKNPNSGLFWAGDTAQTISIGSAFRFNDLKAFLYTIETNGFLRAAPRSIQHPRSFQLAVNYRSHAGIVNCAHSIIELITHFWPYAIDRLAQEKGVIDGNKPVFFSGPDSDSIRLEQFLFGKKDARIEFGAHQCILVRDNNARVQLRQKVGRIGIIMTLYESKGLEFDDVLLYNFFEDSPANASQWRVVLSSLPEDAGVKAPQYKELDHSIICQELKFLYVATTRARMNLWIADGSEKAKPMHLYWTAKHQTNDYTPGMGVSRLASESTPQQWANAGDELFRKKRYEQAIHCYERASPLREKALPIAQAFYLREEARSLDIPTTQDVVAQSKAFAAAAKAFWDSAENADEEKLVYFRISAECYVSSGDHGKAAQAYYRKSDFDLAAQHYRKAGMFDDAIAVVRAHREAMDEVIVNSIEDAIRLAYLRDRKLPWVGGKARELFESDQEALEYMDDYGFNIARISLLKKLGRYAEAAEIHLEEGRTIEAIHLFLRDKQNTQSVRRASRSLLDGMWRNLSFGVDPNSDLASSNTTLRDLRPFLDGLDITDLDEQTCDEVNILSTTHFIALLKPFSQILMFRAIVSNNLTALSQIGEKFHNHHHNDIAALMCLDRVFPNLPNLGTLSTSEIASQLQLFLLYARLLHKLITTAGSGNARSLEHLFAFEYVTEEFFLVPTDTLLFTRCRDQRWFSKRYRDTNGRNSVRVLRWDLLIVIHGILRERLWSRVGQEENGICSKALITPPCLNFVVYGRCGNPECPREHITSAYMNLQTYNSRVRILVQQILIYRTICMHQAHRNQTKDLRRYWLFHLYEALHPSFYQMGGLHNLSGTLIPELEEGLQIVGIWTCQLLRVLQPYPSLNGQSMFLTDLLRHVSLNSTSNPMFLRSRGASGIDAFSWYRPQELLRGKQGDYVVHDALLCTNNTHLESLNAGVLFVLHIITNRIAIDVGVLFDFLDRLCGMLVVADRNRRFEPTTILHGITLPRSWLMGLAGDFGNLKNRRSNLIFLYVRPMADLLEQIYTGVHAEYLIFGSKNFAQYSFNIKNVFMLRLCKNLALLGCNVRNPELKANIYRCITSIRYKPGMPHTAGNTIFAKYVYANNWSDLSRIVSESVSGTSLDEIIELHEAGKPSHSQPSFPRARRIVYKSLNELLALLGSVDSPLPLSESQEIALVIPQATAHETNDLPSTSARYVEVIKEQVPTDGEVDRSRDAADDFSNIEDITLVIAQPRKSSLDPTPEELKAVCIMQSACRKYLRRHALRVPMSARLSMRTRLYSECLKASDAIEWSQKSQYKFLFLGPVPHLLVSIECTRLYLHDAKTKAKKRAQKVKDSDLEEVNALMNNLSPLLKKAIQLEKDLRPQSEFHKRRDVGELKRHAQKVEDLVRALPRDVAEGWEEELKLAMKGIVKTKVGTAEKRRKPVLNVQDCDPV